MNNLFTNPSFPRHQQISPTIFLCVHKHQASSDNQSHSSKEIIDDEDEEEDENTCKNGTSTNDCRDEDEIEVIRFSDDDDDEVILRCMKRKKGNLCENLPRDRILITHGLSCGECSALIDTRPKLIQHFIKMHEDKFPFKCMLRGCDAQFKNRPLLTQHYTDHERNCTKWICSAAKCPFESVNRRRFMVHVHLYHECGLFQCAYCLVTYSHRSAVYNHYKATHEYQRNIGNRRFPCTVKGCEFLGLNNYQLKRHRLAHAKFKPFRCTLPFCDYAANYRGDVIQHIQDQHLHSPVNVPLNLNKFVAKIPYKEAHSKQELINFEKLRKSQLPNYTTGYYTSLHLNKCKLLRYRHDQPP